jgi:hypothetical protein
MSLRTRLIIAFVLMSVVPLSAVTLVSYLSSVRAFEQAARREARWPDPFAISGYFPRQSLCLGCF